MVRPLDWWTQYDPTVGRPRCITRCAHVKSGIVMSINRKKDRVRVIFHVAIVLL